MPISFSFTPLHESHFALLLKWLESPHVKKWWDQDLTYTIDLVHQKYGAYVQGDSVRAFVICNEQVPIGYIQLYKAQDFMSKEAFINLPPKSGGIDIYIGEEKYLGHNMGSEAILSFLKEYAQDYTHIVVDPDPENKAAVRCFEKIGFERIEGVVKDSVVLWMIFEQEKEAILCVDQFC